MGVHAWGRAGSPARPGERDRVLRLAGVLAVVLLPLDALPAAATDARVPTAVGPQAVGLPAVATGVAPGAEQGIAERTNTLRAQVGVRALRRNSEMDRVAETWARHLAAGGSLSHNPDYSTQIPTGWHAAAENVAFNQAGGPAMFAQWKASSSHRANLVDARFTHFGVGVWKSGNSYWGVQVFAAYSSPPAGTDTAVAGAADSGGSSGKGTAASGTSGSGADGSATQPSGKAGTSGTGSTAKGGTGGSGASGKDPADSGPTAEPSSTPRPTADPTAPPTPTARPTATASTVPSATGSRAAAAPTPSGTTPTEEAVQLLGALPAPLLGRSAPVAQAPAPPPTGWAWVATSPWRMAGAALVTAVAALGAALGIRAAGRRRTARRPATG